MSHNFAPVFERLRSILQKYADTFTVTEDALGHYCLSGRVGPATLKAWGGKMKKPIIPVAWVQIDKAYVSYHLMGVYGNPDLRNSMSKQLQNHMQGKTCFNFKTGDEALFQELEQVTADGLDAFRKTGYITE
jgi:hypothetical protein